MIKPSAQASIDCVYIGEEKQPVLIIDNFLDNPEALIQTAKSCRFTRERKLYPGVRSSAPSAYTACLEAVLPPLLAQYFGIQPSDINHVESSYSLVTTAPNQLKLLQKLPHFDSQNPNELASVYFLCNRYKQLYGGTAFYRHKASGFEYVDQSRFASFIQELEGDLQNTVLSDEYISCSTDIFEQIAHIEARYNRLVMYRGTSLHSGVIGHDFDFSQDPANARLSINTFLLK